MSDLLKFMRNIRRDIHRYPELGFQETRTAAIIASELQSLALEVTPGVGKTGVTAVLEGSNPGPVTLVRVDMDALPIQEETGVDYASQNPGVMHACGHDGHVAIGLGAARLLSSKRNDLKGAVKFVFQPAEEGLGGAEAMITAGVLTYPACDYALAVHLWNDLPVGTLGITQGPVMAGSDTFFVKILGRGGHGALPHQSHDPIVAAAAVISGLQTIIARNIPPLEMAVVSVTGIKSGNESYNTIPSEVVIRGTIRSYKQEIRRTVLERFDKIVRGYCEALNCTAQIIFSELTPPVVNAPKVAEAVRNSAREILPECEVLTDYRTTVSEDMAYFLEKVPGCYILIGSGPEDGEMYGHHHPRFNFDERAMLNAALLIERTVMNLAEM